MDTVENALLKALNRMFAEAKDVIHADLSTLLEGRENRDGKIIRDFITGEGFLAVDSSLYPKLREGLKRLTFASAINEAWKFDRPYLVDTDAPNGCQEDDRGASEYRICLEEHPNRSFWLYALNRDKDKDSGENDETHVRGPTRYRAFNEPAKGNLNITLKDIVRSSLFVHTLVKDIREDSMTINGTGLTELVRNDNNTMGNVAGIFTISVCRNPKGEAISSVFSDDGRNYPCLCGEFSWDDPDYTFEKDQTTDFLIKSGFAFSEDWEHYCDSHNDCEDDESIDLRNILNDKRRKGDPEITEELGHPWFKCKKPKDHKDKGDPHGDDIN